MFLFLYVCFLFISVSLFLYSLPKYRSLSFPILIFSDSSVLPFPVESHIRCIIIVFSSMSSCFLCHIRTFPNSLCIHNAFPNNIFPLFCRMFVFSFVSPKMKLLLFMLLFCPQFIPASPQRACCITMCFPLFIIECCVCIFPREAVKPHEC